jgi:hypothetical protein
MTQVSDPTKVLTELSDAELVAEINRRVNDRFQTALEARRKQNQLVGCKVEALLRLLRSTI